MNRGLFTRSVNILLSATAFCGLTFQNAVAGDDMQLWNGSYAGVSISGHGSLGRFDIFDFWDDNGYEAGSWDARQGAIGPGIGGYIGHNWQNGSRVYGIELNGEWMGGHRGETYFDVADASYWGRFEIEQNWVASLRGRAGVAMDNTLAYITGGIAAGGIPSGIYAPDKYTRAIRSGTYFGHVLGAGMETALSDRLALRIEGAWTRLYTGGYQYDGDNDYGEDTYFADTDDFAVTFGLTYKLGSGFGGARPPRDWSGAYAGVAASGIAVNANFDAYDFWDDNGYDSRDSYPAMQTALGGALGLYAGYNFQQNNIVYGVEGTFDFLMASGMAEFDVVDDYSQGQFLVDANWIASVRGRAGIADGNALAYLTAGLAFGKVQSGIYAPDKYTRAIHSAVDLGVVVGAGIEQAIDVNGTPVILRAEGTWTRLFTGGTESFPDNDYGDEMTFGDTDIIAFKIGIATEF